MANGITEFCCRSGGSNLNAGTLVGDSTEPGTSPSFIYESGNWDSSTGEFVVAAGNPSSDGVAVTQYASVYVSGTGVTDFVGQVSAVSTSGITIDLADHYAGTAPTTGSGNRSLRIGGAWQGPNGAEGFPLDFVRDLMASGTDADIRVNMKNDQTYSITSGIVIDADNNINIWGYSTSYGDKSETEIQGPATGTSFTLLDWNTTNSTGNTLADIFFNQNGDTGSANGVVIDWGSNRCTVLRVRVANMVARGMQTNGLYNNIIDCEFHNNGDDGVYHNGNGLTFFRYCRFHNNGGDGLSAVASQNRHVHCYGCIFAANTLRGCLMNSDSASLFHDCIFYDNGNDGVEVRNNVSGNHFYNCAFFKNGLWGIDFAGAPTQCAHTVSHCAFGSGTQANSAGDINNVTGTLPGYEDPGNISEVADYNPWNDPDNGDFTLKSDSLLSRAGFNFTQRNTAFDGTVSNRTIGATGPSAGGGSSASSYSFFS